MSAVHATTAVLRRFAATVDRAELNGLAFQHLALCRRRAWLHLHRIDYAHLDSAMQRGLAMHDSSRPRDRSVAGLIGLAPDRVDWAGRRVVEAKGGPGAAAAVGRQAAFYALMLWAAQGADPDRPWSAAAHILPAKRERPVPLGPALLDAMMADATELEALSTAPAPPDVSFTPLCARCSYRFLCGAE